MFAAWGTRAAAVGTSAMIMIFLNLQEPQGDQTALEYSLFVALGALWYTILSLSLTQFMPYRLAQQVETGERTVVGVNKFPAPTEPLEVFTIDPGTEAGQAESVRRLRETRDQAAVDAALAQLAVDVRDGRSVMPATIAAVKAYATLGEVVEVLRGELGSWRPSAEF